MALGQWKLHLAAVQLYGDDLLWSEKEKSIKFLSINVSRRKGKK